MFSDENNSAVLREVMMREAAGKTADPTNYAKGEGKRRRDRRRSALHDQVSLCSFLLPFFFCFSFFLAFALEFFFFWENGDIVEINGELGNVIQPKSFILIGLDA